MFATIFRVAMELLYGKLLNLGWNVPGVAK